MPTAVLITLGCPKNEADSDSFAGCMSSAGWDITDDPDKADVLLLNTCAFIQPAIEEAIETISHVIRWKEEAAGRKLILAGCLPGRFADDGSGGLEDFDLIIGPGDTDALREYISVSDISLPISAEPGSFRYLKISEGCSNNCSYCTIPMIRGGHVSRSIDDIIRDAEALAAQGASEIGIVGQDTGNWRDGEQDLSLLVSILAESYPDTWFRVYYTHPSHFQERLIELMGTHRNIMPYLDIPIQHVSDAILDRMGRPYNEPYLRRLFDLFEGTGVELAVRTSVIIGYPGETQEDFRTLTEFLTDYSCIRTIAAFPYWPEEGTLEYSRSFDSLLTGEDILQSRLMRMGEISEEIYTQWAGRMEDRIIDVLADSEDMGHSRFDAPSVDGACIFKATVVPGTFYQCRVVESWGADMLVETVD